MGQITLFPGPVVRAHPSERVAHVLLAEVDDRLDRWYPVPTDVVRLRPGVGLRYVPAWELAASGARAHLRIQPLTPSAPDRRVIAETLDGQVLEQDHAGSLWLDDTPLHGGPLLSFCALPDQCEATFGLSERAGLLLGDRSEGTFVFTVRVLPQLLWIHERPRMLGVVGTFGGWMLAASQLVNDAEERDRKEEIATSDADDRDSTAGFESEGGMHDAQRERRRPQLLQR
jgi:hypothetical protein